MYTMNKIYKVIWSKVKACYVVVSELAKRHSKGKSLKSAASLVALTAILAFLPVQVNATDVAPGDNIAQLKALNTKVDNLPSIHYFSVKSDDSANPDGTNWKNDGASGENAIAIGKDAKAKTKASVVVGLNASSGDAATDGVAVGNTASVTGFGGVAIGRKSSAQGQETVAIGTGAKGVLNGTIAIGGYANADGVGAVSIGRGSSSKRLGVSVGVKSFSEELGVSVGTQSFSNLRSVAVGEEAKAESKYSVAVGDQTASYAEAGVTLGNKTRVYGDSSVAIGNEARVSGKPLTEAEYNALPDAEKSSYKVQVARYPNPADPMNPTIEKTYFKVFNAADWNAETHYNSIAIGTTSFVEAKEAIGIGAATWIHGDRGVALGYTAVSGEKGTALGAGAQAKANAGVALGEGAVADTAAKVAGYDPQTGKASTETTPTWKSMKGAVSVGNADATRQITNLAAGSADTDAVNVAQLKALNQKVDDGAVHYYSVKSDQQGAGTNYANDGAKAADSMVIGISSSISEKAKNSTVLGNNNTLSNQPNARGVERDSENNSIVVGQNLTVEGARNAVFGTDYQNGTDKLLTHVAGERNTVIGVGNLVGYTAERVGTEWKYTKFKGHGDDENVVVGLTNTVNGGGVVVGTNTTVSAYGGVAFGHHNTVSGNEDKGVALGNDLNVSGYGALAVGTESAATGDYTIALGVESKAQAQMAASMGYDSQAKASGSVALGAWSSAEAKQALALGYDSQAMVAGGVALGAKSVANRGKDVLGYDPVTGAAFANDAAVAAALGKTAELTAAETNIANAQTAVTAAQQAYDADRSDANRQALKDAKNTLNTAKSKKNELLASYKSVFGAVSVGRNDGTRQITNLAAGTEDTDAVNVAQLKALSQKTDNQRTHYYHVNDGNSPAGNYNNDGAKGGMALAAGAGAVANGTASAATGAFNQIQGNGATGYTTGFQGATSSIYGSFNTIAGKDGVVFDGVANSLVGVANRTENANGALIFGAGNKVTNSYREVSAGGTPFVANAAEALQKAIDNGDNTDMIGVLGGMVKESGGSVLVIGGANTANYALLSKVVGVGNTLTGTSNTPSEYNMLDGFANTAENVQHVSVIGSNNKLSNTKNAILLGDNRKLTGANGSIVLGAADAEKELKVADAVLIGHNADVQKAGGVALGAGSVASVDKGVAGYDPTTKAASKKTDKVWKSTLAAVSVGNADNTRQITNVAAGFEDTDAVNVAQLKAVDKKVAVVFDDKNSLMSIDAKIKHEILEDPGRFPEGEGQSIALGKDAYAYMQGGRKAQGVLFGMKKATGAIAIGQNAKALSHSIAIGNRLYAGDMGDVKISPSDYNVENGSGVASTLLGNNSYAGGTLSTLVGSYSIMSTSYPGGHQKAYMQNAGAVSVGALNSIESATAKQGTSFFGKLPDDKSSGVANSVVGLANRAYNANGALIYGAGNEITNSIASVTAPAATGSVKAAAENLRKAIKTNPGGAVLAIGGGNKADLAVRSQLIGVANTLTGTSETPSEYNMLDGFNNTGTNVKHITLMGSENTVSDTTGAILLGDKRKLTGANGSIVLGAADTEKELTVTDAVLIGHNADVQKAGGVALGAGSVASVDKGVAGYDPSTGEPSTATDNAAWTSTLAAVSVGNAKTKDTRQITNVAAGSEDTDAVNVAQLKALNKQVTEGAVHYFSVKADDSANPAGTNWNNDGAKSTGSIAVGQKARTLELEVEPWKTPEKISSDHAVALGSDASAAGNGSVAIGKNAVTGTRFATESLGGGASLTTAHNIAGDGAVAVGDSSQAGTEGSVAIGRKATAGYYGALLNHTTKEKKSYGIAIGDGAKAIGNYNRYSRNDNRDDAGLAVGRQAYAAGNGTIAMGYKAHAANTQNIIIGSNASTKALFKNDGEETVHPISSVGIGSDVVVKGRYSVALGPGASVGNGKLNLPESTSFMDFGGVALGYKSQVDRPGSVGLGSWTRPWRQVDPKHPIVDPEHPEQPIDEQTKYADGKKVVAPFSGQKLYFKDDIGGAQVYHAMGSNSVVNGVVSVGGVYEGLGGRKIPFLRQIINVADGTEDTDAVNLRQLKAVNADVTTDIKALQDGFTVSNAAGEKQNIALGGDTKQNIKFQGEAGKIDVDVAHASDGATVTVKANANLGKNIDLSSNTTVTNITNNLSRGFELRAGTESTGAKIALDGNETPAIRFDVAEADKGLTVTREGNTVKYGIDGSKIDLAENAAITNITNNLSQASAWKLQVNGKNERVIGKDNVVNFVAGSYTEVTADGNDVKIGLNKAAKDKLDKVDTLEGKIKANKVQVTGDAATGVKVAGTQENDGSTTYKVSLGEKIQVGGVTMDGAGDNRTITGLTNTSLDVAGFATSQRAATEEQLQAAMTQMSANAKITTVESGDENIVVNKTEGQNENKYTVALNKNLNVDSLNAGGTQVNKDGISVRGADGKPGVTITKNGIDAGNKKITNVADGVDAHDAATVGQLGKLAEDAGKGLNELGNQISKLDGRVNKVGAGAAALAAMHPLDFDPDDKWNVSAGYGSYKGSHAGAIGAFYRPDENTMFNIGASVGGGENMVNAGVTFALDRKSHITTSRTAMAREIMDLRKEITELKAARANGNWMLDPEMTKLFPDVPENHWAYEYIAKLAGNGIIKGYPDGSFAGNRMMTRYEFAALLYRAMENGANVDARALKEFAPEMGRIRVDRVYGKDNDRNKIERVRVNNENTQERDTYGSKIQIAAK